MNETITTILNRRSVRSYSAQQIKEEDLNKIIESGLYAPSAHNQQSWHFTVLQNKEIIDNLNIASKKAMHELNDEHLKKYAEDENFHLFYNAPAVIVVSGEKSSLLPHIDCAAATQNMLIAAESLNIGSCWIGLVTPLFKSENAGEFIKFYSIPENYELYYAVAFGYKNDENHEPAQRRENTVNFIK